MKSTGLKQQFFKLGFAGCIWALANVVALKLARANQAEPQGLGPEIVLTKGGSKAQQAEAKKENAVQALRWLSQTGRSGKIDLQLQSPVRPYADYEEAGYLFISDEFRFGSRPIKEALVRNTPPDVTVVVFADDDSIQTKNRILRTLGLLRDPATLKVIALPDALRGFWARDGLPVPVMRVDSGVLGVVDARYYHNFEPDREVATGFSAGMTSHRFYFEGGNFMANRQGLCIIVNNDRHDQIPDSIFQTQYGCNQLIRLRHLLGIGHVDERVRFLDDDTVVTDLPNDYRRQLEAAGLTVIAVPRPSHSMYTYVNSLIVNGIVFIPIFGESTDAAALKAYEDFGYTAKGVRSNELSADGQGSIHCITMTYPKQPFEMLIKAIGAIPL